MICCPQFTDFGRFRKIGCHGSFLGMKKILIIFGVCAAVTALSSCSSTSERTPTLEELSAESVAPPPPTAPMTKKSKRVRAKTQSQVLRERAYFDWPVDEARMSRGFLPNRRRPHLGIDLAAPQGTPILASHEGTVIYTGRDFRGFGKLIMIEGSKGWATLYAHMSTITVKEGQKVRQGEVIGGMGRTGRASGVHLHFEIRNAQGPVDPLHYLPAGLKLASRQ
jgi:murein DD-endopeptidase MepM/ murein hydrolase activator NlpD